MKYKDKLQEKIAKEYGLDKLVHNHSYDNKPYNEETEEWYWREMDKFIAKLIEKNGTTNY